MILYFRSLPLGESDSSNTLLSFRYAFFSPQSPFFLKISALLPLPPYYFPPFMTGDSQLIGRAFPFFIVLFLSSTVAPRIPTDPAIVINQCRFPPLRIARTLHPPSMRSAITPTFALSFTAHLSSFPALWHSCSTATFFFFSFLRRTRPVLPPFWAYAPLPRLRPSALRFVYAPVSVGNLFGFHDFRPSSPWPCYSLMTFFSREPPSSPNEISFHVQS